jgi:hypothetical protein
MNLTLLKGYPDFVGKRATFVGYGNGPTSYALGGDTLNLPLYNYYTDALLGPAITVSGNYLVTPYPAYVGPRQVWKLRWSPTYTVTGENVALSLGTLSAAATTSAMTANGVGTVVVANSLVPGNFVLLTGGASGKAIFMNGQIVQVVTASSTQFTYNYGPAKALSYASAADTGLKFQLVQGASNNLVQLGTATGQVATITAASVASQVATITAANTFSPGQFVVLQGLAAGEVTNGVICHILTASATQFTAAVQCPNVTNASDTGTATLLVTNGNIPIATLPAQAITGITVAATAASASAAGALTVMPAANNYIPGNLAIVEGLTHGAVLNGQIYPVLAASLTGAGFTANAYLNAAVSTGTADLGAASVLATGFPAGIGEVYPGTNLSAEQIQIGGFCGQY